MKKECNIVKDLLPLYLDDVCSKESKELVLNHLKNCDECQKELENLKISIKKDSKKDLKILESFKNKLDLKIFRRVLIIVSLIFLTLLGLTRFYNSYEFTLPYNEKMYVLYHEPDSKNRWNFQIASPYYDRAKMMRTTIFENNEEVNIIFLTFTATPHSYLSKSLGSTAPDLDYVNIDTTKKMRVYYTETNFKDIKKASLNELENIIKDSIYLFSNEIKTKTLDCTLNDQNYNYTVTYYDQNGQVIESSGDTTIPQKLNYSADLSYETTDEAVYFTNIHKVLENIEKYFTENGGTCSRK